MTWLELVQQMQALGFSPGEACTLASLIVALFALRRRVAATEERQRKAEQQLRVLNGLHGLEPEKGDAA